MPSKRVTGILIVAAMAVPAVGLPDWKGDLAKKTVGRAAREGIEDALKDEAVDAALSAAARGGAPGADAQPDPPQGFFVSKGEIPLEIDSHNVR